MKYMVNRGAKEIGQFELADIQALMNAGVILPTDSFWFQGMTEAKPVSSLFAQESSLSPRATANIEPPTRLESIVPAPTPKEDGPCCPTCKSTDVIKAYAAYEKYKRQYSFGAATIHGPTLSGGGNSINNTGLKCAPPAKPKDCKKSSPKDCFPSSVEQAELDSCSSVWLSW